MLQYSLFARLAQLVERSIYTRRVAGSSPASRTKYKVFSGLERRSYIFTSKIMNIIYEDNSILAIDKPPGVLTHTDGRDGSETVASFVAQKYPNLLSIGGEVEIDVGGTTPRSGVLHRIDKETSGIVLVAKTQAAFDFIKKQFDEHTLEKTYKAFVHGVLNDDMGAILKPIGRSKGDFRRRAVGLEARGTMREAHTNFFVLKRGRTATYINVFPKTGRTHQIRVHLKSISAPIIGDTLYAPDKPELLGFKRLALHAESVEFVHPETNETCTVTAPLPEDFRQALIALESE